MPKTEEQQPSENAASAPTEPAKLIALPSGYELSGTTAAPITQGALARVVVLAGPVGSGKTSLLAAVYDLFSRGKIRGYSFAGSQTLLAFERRCHPSRIASERAQSDTERTKLDADLKLLHLKVRRQKDAQLTDLLATDPSGEAFLLARDSTDECRKLTIVARADVVVLCLDGAALAKRRTRAGTIADARTLLRSMLDSDVLGRNSHVQVLFTKADQLKHPEGDSEASLFATIEAEFRGHFESRVRRLAFLRTSVVPLSAASGVEEIIQAWATHDGLAPAEIIHPVQESARLYDRFGRTSLNGN